MHLLKSKFALTLVIISLLSGMAFTACSGQAVIDINYDATQGVGNIVIAADDDPDQVNVDVDNDGDSDLSQVLLFGLVAALLLGTVAIVISVSRRPRGEV